MSKISDIAQNYRPPTRTVIVMLTPNDDAMRRREELLTAIVDVEKAAGERLARKAPTAKLREELAALEKSETKFMRTLRFTKLDGIKWAELTAKYGPREDVAFDAQLGYNHHAVALIAAKVNGTDVTDGAEEPLDDADWETIHKVASGWDIENIATAVLEMNVMRSARTIGRLKKD